jgi:hypothetical protein
MCPHLFINPLHSPAPLLAPLRSENSDQLLSQQIPMLLPPASSTPPPLNPPPPPPPSYRLNRGWGGKGIGGHWTATAGQLIESHLTILLAHLPPPHPISWGCRNSCAQGVSRPGPGNAVSWRKGTWRDGP